MTYRMIFSRDISIIRNINYMKNVWLIYWHNNKMSNDDVMKWNHFLRYWPSVLGNHRSPVNSPHKGQWRGALMFPLICAWINVWANNRETGDLRRHHAHYDAIAMYLNHPQSVRNQLSLNLQRCNMVMARLTNEPELMCLMHFTCKYGGLFDHCRKRTGLSTSDIL